jgi:hypothetical protein
VFDVTLTPASTQPATVHWATSDGTATTPDDYAAASGDLSFAAGETRKSVGVPLVGDALAEPDEVLYVTLSQPAGASTRDGQGRGTVRDDDGVGASVPVAWTDAAGVSVSGNDLAKTARRNWRNAGARSAQTLAAGDGAVELVASETNLSRVFGLSRGSANLSYKEIDFAIGLMENGQLQVFENGLLRGSFGNYATGDRLRIGVVAGVVQYARNGVVFRTSGVAPRYPLLVDASLYHKRATLQDVRVEGAWH